MINRQPILLILISSFACCQIKPKLRNKHVCLLIYCCTAEQSQMEGSASHKQQSDLQALQQLWESARFTYQVNNPSSQAISQRGTQLTPSASRLKGSAAEDEAEAEAESSGDSDDESQQALPGPSQVVTRRAGTSSALPSSDSRCL